MHSGGLQIIAPGLIEQTWSEAEVLGSAVWLWMHSSSHRHTSLDALPALLLPAIKHRQFILAAEAGRPVFYLSWANLNAQTEQQFIQRHQIHMKDAEWNSGDRMWIFDWVAPFGHTMTMGGMLFCQLFANRCWRALSHRGEERGLKIKNFSGDAVLPEEADLWFSLRPLAGTFATAPSRKSNKTTAARSAA